MKRLGLDRVVLAGTVFFVATLASVANAPCGAAEQQGEQKEGGVLSNIKDKITDVFKRGKTRSEDNLCDSLAETYEVTDNALRLATGAGGAAFIAWQQNGFRLNAGNRESVKKMTVEISKKYLWMPVSVERALGNGLHEQQISKNRVLSRESPRAKELYEKADKALASALKDYAKMPYETQLFIIESEEVNAEALPAGHIYLTRRGAKDLEPSALELVLGHEVAHVAKRHTSKQLQQRLVDVDLAADVLKGVFDKSSLGEVEKLFASEAIIEKFGGVFAEYDQGQELEADACAVRSIVRTGGDPTGARKQYVEARGSQEYVGAANEASRPKVLGLGFTQHPDDENRQKFFERAVQHHKQKWKDCAGGSCPKDN